MTVFKEKEKKGVKIYLVSCIVQNVINILALNFNKNLCCTGDYISLVECSPSTYMHEALGLILSTMKKMYVAIYRVIAKRTVNTVGLVQLKNKRLKKQSKKVKK
jgi:hypothetical protein